MAQLAETAALVTGAGTGIGAAIARDLAAAGAAVVLVGRRPGPLEQVAAQIRERGGVAEAFAADITERAQALRAVEHAIAAFGRLDIVVNNAGVMLVGPVAEAPEGEWESMIDVNLTGTLYVTQAAIPHLVKSAATGPRRVADIVTISSTAGRVARAGNAVYNLTKFGVNAFSEALRQELQPQRVRVGVVEPGTVDTDLATHTRAELRESVQAQVGAIERLAPEDIADAVTYMVGRDRRVAVNEMLVRSADQTW
ncbi:SDR family NAD(P)-dependent oxidoreductase [Nocardia sp. alder85J]|uniref:SDR family NAD(P)-dependent oxidoreductase n=1 Tax=Nocardia sp. alder85J TaxID=2862949 RepID=UPI001CD67240|nr:SDR family NAD(P)-dependent oxidoreductase [Nocardia sp. alder85J]MCX4091718.1 SDR family NAD(P)-dependent oxidoreductase [Nocardia sp. alder85J]